MAVRVAINGFGRTGRAAFRAAFESGADIEWVAINDVADPAMLAQLLKYDTVYGPFDGTVEAVDGAIVVDGVRIVTPIETDPASLPWAELGVDVVIESTGRFRARADAAKHLEAGREEGDHLGAGQGAGRHRRPRRQLRDVYDPERHHIISNASCTTNCLAPVAKVLHEALGIRHGLMTTIHAYTGDQQLLDGPHKDYRRARAAAAQPRADLDRGREGDRPRRPGARRQAAGLRRPRPGADRLARRPDRRGRAADVGRRR